MKYLQFHVVGFVGAPWSGRSTAADLFAELFNDRAGQPSLARIAFSDAPVRGLMAMLQPLGLKPDHFLDPEKYRAELWTEPETGKVVTPFTLYDSLRHEWGPGVDKALWLAVLEMTLRAHMEMAQVEGAELAGAVIPDVETEEEAELVRAYGGTVVEIRASDAVREKRVGGRLPEHEWVGGDISIDNNGTIDDLRTSLALNMARIITPSERMA